MKPDDDSFDVSKIFPECAGLWTAWDRDQTRILGTGHTFEEAKQAAAETGESSVILAQVPPSFSRRARRWSQVVAVFISLVPSISTAFGQGTSSTAQTNVAPISSTMPDDDSTDQVDTDDDAQSAENVPD